MNRRLLITVSFLALVVNVQSVKEDNDIAKKLLSLLMKKSASAKKSSQSVNMISCMPDPSTGRVFQSGQPFLIHNNCRSCTYDDNCKLNCVPSRQPGCTLDENAGAPSSVCWGPAPTYWYKPGDAFTLLDGCYRCTFDHQCEMTCSGDNGACSQPTKRCEYNGKFYGVGAKFEGTCKPGSCSFDMFCEKSCMCARDVLDLLNED